jgi:hypothetical protein
VTKPSQHGKYSAPYGYSAAGLVQQASAPLVVSLKYHAIITFHVLRIKKPQVDENDRYFQLWDLPGKTEATAELVVRIGRQ